MITTIRACVADEFQQVNELIIEQLRSDVAMVENVGHYIVDAGGKRLRPLLVLLAAGALDDISPDDIKFAQWIAEVSNRATHLAFSRRLALDQEMRCQAQCDRWTAPPAKKRKQWSNASLAATSERRSLGRHLHVAQHLFLLPQSQ